MDASTSSTMVGDLAVRSSGSSLNNSKFNATKAQKGHRLDSIAARLQTPARACGQTPVTQTNGNHAATKRPSTSFNNGNSGLHQSIKLENGTKIICHQCMMPIKNGAIGLTCSCCKKNAHRTCVAALISNDVEYLCLSCRKNMPSTSSIEDDLINNCNDVEMDLDTRATSVSNASSTTPTSAGNSSTGSSVSARKSSIVPTKYSIPPVINTDFDTDSLPAQLPTGSSFTSSIDEDMSISNSDDRSDGSSPSGDITANNSVRNSPFHSTPTSDNEESRPSSSKRQYKDLNDEVAVKEKKKPGRKSNMKTRSGGQPPNSFYAQLGKTAKGRRPSVKGKGKMPKTRRPRQSNKLSYIQAFAATIRRESDDTNDTDEPTTRQPDENDYIRTAIVSSCDNAYICHAPMCLICGSIGRDVEGTMMNCMSCAQNYHSYCVNMHEKLNKTIVKRGWRCLQCTVCEVCGDGADESNLLLCDECDVAFHTYCLEPKLDKIPTGSWRCQWCATCRRCNKQVQSQADLQKLDGLCEACYSMRKCPKCLNLYEAGEMMIRCQHCSRWFHGACEDLLTEEQLENAYENAFRCSLCRPRAHTDYNDLMNSSVIVDNVMINKSALPLLCCGRSASSLGGLMEITGSFRSQSTDQTDPDDIMEEIDIGAAGKKKITGPGRRQPKYGIGGFFVRNRNRMAQSIEDDPDDVVDEKMTNGKGKRRPRKPRRHQLEDAYPQALQSAFWGGPGTDGKGLIDKHIEEPTLSDSPVPTGVDRRRRQIYELSEDACEFIRSQQEQEMLGDVFGADGDLDIDMDNFDFSGLFGEDDEEMADDTPPTNENTQESVANAVAGDRPTSQSASDNPNQRKSDQKKQRNADGNDRCNTIMAWEQDEPFGDKATKAAVLFANVTHPDLKVKYPNWNDRYKQIHRIWRTLDSKMRQEYVSRARENKKASRFLVHKQRMTNPPEEKPEAEDLKPLDSDIKEVEQKPNDIKVELTTENQTENFHNTSQRVATLVAKINSKTPAGPPSPKDEPIPENGTPMADNMVTPAAVDSMILDAPIKSELSSLKVQLSPISSISSSHPQMTLAQSRNIGMGANIPHINGGLLTNGENIENKNIQNLPCINNVKELTPNMSNVSSEISLMYEELKKEQDALNERLTKVEAEIIAYRKAKKSLNARRRQLNKNAQVNDNGERIDVQLSESDQQKMAQITRMVPERSAEKDRLYKRLKELTAKIDEVATKYGIIPGTPIQPEQPPPIPASIQQYPANGFSSTLSALRSDRTVSSDTLSERTPSAIGNFPGSTILMNGNDTLRRTDSLSSLLSDNGENVPFDPPKSTRGRKRKKVEPIKGPLPAVLGGISYALLTDQVERDVYELVDILLHQVSIHDGEDLSMLSRAPSALTLHSPDFEGPKKKKRNTNKKAVPVNEASEYTQIISNITEALSQLSALPPTVLNPFPALDPRIDHTRDITKFMEQVAESPAEGTKFGFINLEFISDFYGEFEDYCCTEPESPELQIRCCDLYGDIQYIDDYDEEYDEVYVDSQPEPYHTLDFESELPREELQQLSINMMVERENTEYVIPMLHRWPDIDNCPTDPPRTAYTWLNSDEMIDLDLVLYHDDDIETSALFQELAEILDPAGTTELLKCMDYEVVESPMLSPVADSCPEIGDAGELLCHGCKNPIEDDGFEVEEKEPFPHFVIYCSTACCKEFQLQNGEAFELPLHTELGFDTPLKIEIYDDVDMREDDPELPSPERNEASFADTEQLAVMEQLRQSRWEEFSVSDLPPPPKPTIEVTPGGSRAYKFRGQGWLICDEKLLASFRIAPDDTHDVIRKSSNAWMQYRSADNRICSLCNELGDGLPALTGRLLNVDANEWVHVNCAVWSAEVHESECGGLNNVQAAIEQAQSTYCLVCDNIGASVKCIKLECENWYHLPCAFKAGCKFMKDITVTCPMHCQNVHPEVNVSRLEALRRIYIEREENALLAKIYNHSFSSDMIMRVGNMVFYNIGQLLPDQLKTFHSSKFIFPNGFRVVRFFWHPTQVHERIGYECIIEDRNNSPVFRISFEGREIRDTSPQGVWQRILNAIHQSREKANNVLRFFPSQVCGDDLFGLSEVAITKMTESLPGVDSLNTYEFKHGGSPLMEVPLAINPTGCARTEPCFRTLIKSKKTYFVSPTKNEEHPDSREENHTGKRRRRRPAMDFSGIYDEDTLRLLKASGISEEMLVSGVTRLDTGYATGQLYTRYKNMKDDWRGFVSLGRSGIAGFGLYAKRDIDMNQMVIEYVGEVIRSEVCEIREKMYSQKNKGIYMFRIDADYVIDATMSGNLARYINHSCDPNCYTQIVTIDNDKKIVIFAGRPIKTGEELTYDYQFELEDTEDKIPCLCGAPNCVKWMN